VVSLEGAASQAIPTVASPSAAGKAVTAAPVSRSVVSGRGTRSAVASNTVAFLCGVLSATGDTLRVIVTDKLASFVPAVRRVLPMAEHRRHKCLNNRAENSHLPVRKHERILQRFKSAGHAQYFLESFSGVCNQFRPRRHRLSAHQYPESMQARFSTWQEVVGVVPHP